MSGLQHVTPCSLAPLRFTNRIALPMRARPSATWRVHSLPQRNQVSYLNLLVLVLCNRASSSSDDSRSPVLSLGSTACNSSATGLAERGETEDSSSREVENNPKLYQARCLLDLDVPPHLGRKDVLSKPSSYRGHSRFRLRHQRLLFALTTIKLAFFS